MFVKILRPSGFGRLVALPLILCGAGARAAEPRSTIPAELLLQRFTVAGDGNILLLPVRIDGKDHLFAVDSGCGQTAFDLTLPLGKPRRRGTTVTFNGGVEVTVYEPPDARVGAIPLGVAEVTGLDLGWAREVWGHPIEGILGMDFLGRYVLRLDLDRGELSFLKAVPGDAGEAVAIEWQPGEIPRVMAGFSATERVPFAIDTGSTAQGSGTLGAFAARGLIIDDELRALGTASSETAGGRYSSRVYRGKRLTLGGFTVDNPIFKETQRLSVLGLGFWSRFTVTFDFPGRRAYLRKGERYDRSDLWNASGLRLRLKSGVVIVDAVEQESAGARAGVVAGDRLLELGGLVADKSRLFELKSMLHQDGRLGLRVRRQGRDHSFSIDLRQ